jgi:hypothetical protein
MAHFSSMGPTAFLGEPIKLNTIRLGRRARTFRGSPARLRHANEPDAEFLQRRPAGDSLGNRFG